MILRQGNVSQGVDVEGQSFRVFYKELEREWYIPYFIASQNGFGEFGHSLSIIFFNRRTVSELCFQTGV